MYCFGNGSEELKCKYCGMRESEAGIKKKLDIPEIQVYKKELLIKFGAEVIAQEFAGYFGEIQNRVLRRDTEEIVVVDLSETRYINHFCISKILLTLFACKDYKKIKLCLPSSKNKMLRYIYNLGILDYIFECNYIDIYVSDKKIDSYNDIYDFSECYDHSILPYYIYEFCKDENIDLYEQEKRTIENCLSAVRNYFCKEKEQPEKYSKVESRLYLYLQEIIDNVFTHAYGNEKRVFFAINIYNSYLPPYAVYKGTKEEKKFQNRISKFQKNVPMSIYKDIQDRYFGGFNVFIDDIGDGIASTYMLERNENIYRDVYINGSKKRQTINGLKLVADQIAINKDILWAHDTRWWIGTSFIENSSICIQDSSRMLYYEHLPIKGLCYDIFINLAQNSIEKKRTYEKYGLNFRLSLEEIKNMVNIQHVDVSSSIVDILNIKNISVSMDVQLKGYNDFLLYRPRANQKNKMANEIDTRIFSHIEKETSEFKYLVVYDLNQTTLFQAKAVFENEDIAESLKNIGIKKIILITEECWFFGMILQGTFVMNKESISKIIEEVDFKLILHIIHKNDENVLKNLLLDEQQKFVTHAEIYWGRNVINEYIDIEKIIRDRAIADILQKSIARISGLLGEEQKIVFLENYMRTKYGVVVNEFKKNAIQNIYFGSILMTGDTERKVTHQDDIRIYLFKHKECNYEITGGHIILFELPEFKIKKKNNKYRRVLNTNRIELFEKNSNEYTYSLEHNYEKIISPVQFNTGIFDTGFIKIIENNLLDNAFMEFILDIVEIKISFFDRIRIELSDDIKLNNEFCEKLKKQIERNNNSSEYRSKNKIVGFKEDFDGDLVIRIQKNVNIVELISQTIRSSQEMLFISLYCSMRLDTEFYKIVDAGYMPFLPFYYKKNDSIVDNDKLDSFKGFIQTLNPKYRTKIEKYYEQVTMNCELNLIGYTDKNKVTEFNPKNVDKINILWRLINKNLKDEFFIELKNNTQSGQDDLLVNLLLLQHSVLRLDINQKSQNINEIFSLLLEDDMIEDSVITYMMLITLINFSIDRSMFEKFYDKNIAEKLLNSSSLCIKILFANFYNTNYMIHFQHLLNEFFVSSDITIYYNLLAQLLFNTQHGRIHDSKIDKFYKKLDENIESVTEEDINEIRNLIPNCISLLKLTHSYDKSLDIENSLEREFNLYINDIRSSLIQIKDLITKIKDEGKKRFIIIDKEETIKDVKKYVSSIMEILYVNGYTEFKNEVSNINVRIIDDMELDADGLLMRNLKMYNDTIILEELSYLLHNAHFHSYCMFSIEENYKKYKVWIRVELRESVIIIRFLNSIEKGEASFESILGKIHGKKRIGKTYLEKFNIYVSYIHNPQNIAFKDEDFDVMETHIELPFFN